MTENYMAEGLSFDEALHQSTLNMSGTEIKCIELLTLKFLNMETSFSPKTSMLATIPFCLLGLVWVLVSTIDTSAFVINAAYIVAILSMFALLGVGWVNNFPRWALPAIGFTLLISLFLSMITIPSLFEGKLKLFGLLPLGLTLLVSIIIHPSLQPLKSLSDKLKEEPILLLFMLYGTLPFIAFLLSDEIHHPAVAIAAGIISLFIIAGAYFFLRSEKKNIRLISIIVSSVIAFISAIGLNFYYWEFLG